MNKPCKILIPLSPVLLLAAVFTTSQAQASTIAHNATQHIKLAKHSNQYSHLPISALPQQLLEYVFHYPLSNNPGHPPAGNPSTGSGSTWTMGTTTGITGPILESQPPLTAPSDYQAVFTPTPSAVPVPAAMWLLTSGLLGLGLAAKCGHRDSISES